MLRSYAKPALTCLLALVLIGSLAGCKPPPFRTNQGTWTVGTITRDGSDRYVFVDRGNGLRVTAPARNQKQYGDLRMAAVKHGTPTSLNQGSCVTWHGPSFNNVQPGIVLRTRLEADRTRAIMITNNIWGGFRSSVNVHLVDSRTSPGYTPVAAFEMRGALGDSGHPKPLPWRICAQVDGSKITIKAWSIATHPAEPTWTDPVHTASATLPKAAAYPGKPGVYIGHLVAGEVAVLGEHTTYRLPDRSAGQQSRPLRNITAGP